jgi:hypothetical protein
VVGIQQKGSTEATKLALGGKQPKMAHRECDATECLVDGIRLFGAGTPNGQEDDHGERKENPSPVGGLWMSDQVRISGTRGAIKAGW